MHVCLTRRSCTSGSAMMLRVCLVSQDPYRCAIRFHVRTEIRGAWTKLSKTHDARFVLSASHVAFAFTQEWRAPRERCSELITSGWEDGARKAKVTGAGLAACHLYDVVHVYIISRTTCKTWSPVPCVCFWDVAYILPRPRRICKQWNLCLDPRVVISYQLSGAPEPR
jgi:hypothetical protein